MFPDIPNVRHRFVTVRGVRVHVAEAGPDTAPTVVLLHGFPQHWYVWRTVMTDLAADRHVVAVDLPGFGWSDPAVHGYSTVERARDVVALLDALGLDDVDLVGHDWGAWLAFRVALDASDRVRRLVSIGEVHPWPLRRTLLPNVWRMWVTALFEVPGLGVLTQRRRRLVRWFLTRDARTPSTQSPTTPTTPTTPTVWTDDLVDRYATPTARPATARAGQRLHGAFVVRDIPRLLRRADNRRRFTTPTLMIAGAHDTYITPRMMTVPPGRADLVRIQVVDGGHFLVDENPDAVVTAVRAHLALSRPRGSFR